MTNLPRYVDAANRLIAVSGTRFAYRELGPRGGVPLVLMNRDANALKAGGAGCQAKMKHLGP